MCGMNGILYLIKNLKDKYINIIKTGLNLFLEQDCILRNDLNNVHADLLYTLYTLETSFIYPLP
jgi:hypothetical protein